MRAIAEVPEAKIRVTRLNPKQEAFAQAMTHGASPIKAQAAAGYAKDSYKANRRANDPAMIARVEDLKVQLAWGGSEDLRPVIDAMRRLFEDSRELSSAAAVKERREILVQIARLKALLPHQRPTDPPEPPMSRAEWLAIYGPKKA